MGLLPPTSNGGGGLPDTTTTVGTGSGGGANTGSSGMGPNLGSGFSDTDLFGPSTTTSSQSSSSLFPTSSGTASNNNTATSIAQFTATHPGQQLKQIQATAGSQQLPSQQLPQTAATPQLLSSSGINNQQQQVPGNWIAYVFKMTKVAIPTSLQVSNSAQLFF